MALADAVSSAVAHWNMDEASGTRADSIDSHDLTDNNTVGSATGKFSNAADFEADNSEYLTASHHDDLGGADIDFCLRLWFKAETVDGNQRGMVIKGEHTNNPFNFDYALILTLNGDLQWHVSAGAGGQTSIGTGFLSISADTWYLVHAWHDSVNNEIGVCFNAGTPVTASWSNGVRNGTGPLWMGAQDIDGAVRLFDGLIDDVVFLRGYILDSDERTEDYNGGDGVAFEDWAAAPTLQQHSFRYYNEDGDEDEATAAAALNTDISRPPNTPARLRILSNATGDLATQALKLQYRKVGDSNWTDVGGN